MTSPREESRTGIDKSLHNSARGRVLLIFGTRPEAIKLSPLVQAFRDQPACSNLEVRVCVTGQHREMLDQVLTAFDIRPDYDLNLMRPKQTLTGLTSRSLAALEHVFTDARPSLTVVQGDTTSTLCGALAAFYNSVPVAHVEAGLRTFDMTAPFPEEMNRVLTARLAVLHFAATNAAAENLCREGVASERIHVTGNTGIDAVLSVRDRLARGPLNFRQVDIHPAKRVLVVTAHRRESTGPALDRICRAVARIAERRDVQIVWPVHANPSVSERVRATLGAIGNVLLCEPLDYVPFVDLLRRAYLAITDSGGIQEEGPSLGTPILVVRNNTERPEAVDAGTVKLIGTNEDAIVAETFKLLDRPAEHARMAAIHNPYGDGHASSRIANTIAAFLGH